MHPRPPPRPSQALSHGRHGRHAWPWTLLSTNSQEGSGMWVVLYITAKICIPPLSSCRELRSSGGKSGVLESRAGPQQSMQICSCPVCLSIQQIADLVSTAYTRPGDRACNQIRRHEHPVTMQVTADLADWLTGDLRTDVSLVPVTGDPLRPRGLGSSRPWSLVNRLSLTTHPAQRARRTEGLLPVYWGPFRLTWLLPSIILPK